MQLLSPLYHRLETLYEPRRGGDEAGAMQWHGYGNESLPSVVRTPPYNESREYQTTIRAQQSQIELLEAEVVRLRKKLSTVPAVTSAPPAIVISDQPAVTPPVAMLYDGCNRLNAVSATTALPTSISSLFTASTIHSRQ